MTTRVKLITGGIAAIFVAALFTLAPTTDVNAGRGSGCEGDFKVDGSSANIAAPEGKSIEFPGRQPH